MSWSGKDKGGQLFHDRGVRPPCLITQDLWCICWRRNCVSCKCSTCLQEVESQCEVSKKCEADVLWCTVQNESSWPIVIQEPQNHPTYWDDSQILAPGEWPEGSSMLVWKPCMVEWVCDETWRQRYMTHLRIMAYLNASTGPWWKRSVPSLLQAASLSTCGARRYSMLYGLKTECLRRH